MAWTALLAATATLKLWHPAQAGSTADQSGLEVTRNLVYWHGVSHAKLDVYAPPAWSSAAEPPGRLPAVVAIHGGSWEGGSRSEYGPQVARLARHGFVVFVPDYRLARAGRSTWPGALEDLRQAIRWIRSHAEAFKVDPDRIVALGSSAGGHLAALLGTASPDSKPGEVSCRVQAVVSLYGPSDLVALRRARALPDDPLSLFVGALPSEAPAKLDAASPARQVSPDDAPMLLIHGSDDDWVPLSQSEDMALLLERAGVRHRLLIVPGARHGFELVVGSPDSRDLLPEILAFLDSVWQVPSRDDTRPRVSRDDCR
jgi:acetyl esterase/lipase